jgi:hypothetical protein
MDASDGPIVYRQLTAHKVNPVNDKLKIEVIDEPGAGGASHHYKISGFDNVTNPSMPPVTGFSYNTMTILFQNGPVAEGGVNGITQEALLAIVADRLRSFQTGKFACEANAIALELIEEAMSELKQRTLKRMERGVEGTLVP